MSSTVKFKRYFSERNLNEIYDSHVSLSAAVGIDNLNQKSFWKIREEQIRIIVRKVRAGNYGFTKFKLKLISKGRGKIPREISIPTIRDRITLRALCEFLADRYKGTIEFKMPQQIIKSVKEDLKETRFDSFIKLDIARFFPSVQHKELAGRLRGKIRNPEIIELILRALQTPTVTRATVGASNMIVGIPQGLAISNILAAAYLLNIDRRYLAQSSFNYHRYVDDILIFCESSQVKRIVGDVTRRCRRLGLEVHDPHGDSEKSVIGTIGESFHYLGYKFGDGRISVRVSSVEKLNDSLVSIFSAYEHSRRKSEEFLLWRLNLRITGCIFQKKAKGWLFFFSEIDDEDLLHKLDRIIDRLIVRFGVTIKPKRFVRSYYQVLHHRHRSTYIPNFDQYDLDDMKGVLTKYFGVNIGRLADEEIHYEFRKRIDKQVRDLLTDVQDVGY